ncbi:MarR family transcriptional regulator [Amycolatopsis rubida]|uniref:DNA-binding transcriptional regulator, MarR family n=1 Tax=Amycolatopsis rubida TaxID=112413 RepID=A0A1I5FGW3_9PSEU|nr:MULTISPECIES: MarR family transcriptional regulator [Amycolatopsis]MYW91907.1 MarR family transcriptional regulator [Amycolatopsis rubida]NEC56892.1 MarR family transcriptional regulator [Amycolatopsis rubida]OAP27936.1 DNA-binding transcriptional repressor MarR [Amycolatopsis sp. M39]SFO22816.1 DNA-binding transcriptional regulator, MarR family [Amycolatopsis rubida]
MSSEREDLVAELLLRSRKLSTETVMFHAAIAEQNGLSAVESKVTDYLARLGPLTPKELAEYAGLAPASVTALVDRLERKGVVNRMPHPDDRRKVLVRVDPANVERAAPLWDFIVAAMKSIAAGYSDEQLQTVIGFLDQAAAITHESTVRLTHRSAE